MAMVYISRPDAQMTKSRLLRHILRKPGNYVCIGETNFDKALAEELERTHFVPPLNTWSDDYMIGEFEAINDTNYVMVYICDLTKDYLSHFGFGEMMKMTDMIEYMIVMKIDMMKTALLKKTEPEPEKPNRIAELEAEIKDNNDKLAKLKADLEAKKTEPEKPKEECCICLDEFEKCKWRCSTCNAGLICKGCHSKMKGVRKCPVCRVAPKHNKKKK